MNVSFLINGREVSLSVAPNELLIDILRDRLHLTGTKRGCSVGECGACTVIIDGKAVASCLVLASQIEGKNITTIEGLRRDGEFDNLQKKFMEHGAVQCGYCTPGMIMSAKALLIENKNPSDEEIQRAIEGNLCRCTGYSKIIEAIKDAAKESSE